MGEIRLLILEDAKTQQITYEDHIKRFNRKEEGLTIVPVFTRNMTEAMNALSSYTFDCAIIDLRLRSDSQLPEGNEFIRHVVGNHRIPIIVVSGYSQDLDECLTKTNLIYKYSKDGDFQEVIKKIVFIYSSGITRMLGQKGRLEELFTKIFWTHIYRNIEIISNYQESVNDLDKVLLRHAVTHLQEYLALTESHGEFEEFLPFEMYISPPIKQLYFTGDIIKKNGEDNYFYIISPACDMAHNGKAKRILIAEIDSPNMQMVVDAKSRWEHAGDDAKRDAEREILKKLQRNSLSNKYHYLPESSKFEGGYINFQKVSSITRASLQEYERVASIAEQFVRDITARFSQYYGRQGQPSFHSTSLERLLPVSSTESAAASVRDGD